MARFATLSEAIAAGFVPASPRVIERHAGAKIVLRSDGHVAVELDWPTEIPFSALLVDARFGRSDLVSLFRERNAGNGIGAMRIMLLPGELESATVAARAAIDKHLAAS